MPVSLDIDNVGQASGSDLPALQVNLSVRSHCPGAPLHETDNFVI